MRKQLTVTVKEGNKDTPYLFNTKKEMKVFLKRCKALKQAYTIKEQ